MPMYKFKRKNVFVFVLGNRKSSEYFCHKMSIEITSKMNALHKFYWVLFVDKICIHWLNLFSFNLILWFVKKIEWIVFFSRFAKEPKAERPWARIQQQGMRSFWIFHMCVSTILRQNVVLKHVTDKYIGKHMNWMYTTDEEKKRTKKKKIKRLKERTKNVVNAYT